ncbi:MAG: DUF5683 domain-containing protein [Cyclobacteriaceae bacterium]|nr:hypothetical protein [Cyclobacteriaceae bacterium]MCH8516639.1 DUF5683 domain-containing protein [Cyclobacteriaceae bacterium]
MRKINLVVFKWILLIFFGMLMGLGSSYGQEEGEEESEKKKIEEKEIEENLKKGRQSFEQLDLTDIPRTQEAIQGLPPLPPDSVIQQYEGIDITSMRGAIEEIFITSTHSPRKAWLYAAVFPGLGQAYNRKWWKIPFIYAGGAVIGFFIYDNNRQYTEFRISYFSVIDNNPATNRFNQFPNLSREQLERGLNFTRRNRDLTVVAAFGLYLLQMVDAHVDAHLLDFDLSDELAIDIRPGLVSPIAGMIPAAGVSVALKFK